MEVRMRALFVTSEAFPLAKTGGLADVSHALPAALARTGVDIRILLPGYPSALQRIENPEIISKIAPIIGISDAKLVSGRLPGTNVPVFLVDAPSLFRRDGGLYQQSDDRDWPDNALRFAFLSHVGARIATGRMGLGWLPDIIHANDWHSGLLPLLLSAEEAPKPNTVFTTHNMAFQGNFPLSTLEAIGVPAECFRRGDIEFYGQISFLKAGLRYADRITTVSPSYAREILTPEFGFGFEGVLRDRGADVSGILNGIDDIVWDPAADIFLAKPFGAGAISGKKACKVALQREFGLPVGVETPLVGFGSRIAHQKMADVILTALPHLAAKGAQLIVVGEGDCALEEEFRKAQSQYPNAVAVHIGYEEALAHRLHAGSDIVLAPARFEPCGLTQLYAMRYGALPIVRRTGGLADTVVDATPAAIAARTATGFTFEEANADGLISALDRALTIHREPLIWRRLQLQAISRDFSWSASAAAYLALYRDAAGLSLQPHIRETGDLGGGREIAMPDSDIRSRQIRRSQQNPADRRIEVPACSTEGERHDRHTSSSL
jgi:starch synthase